MKENTLKQNKMGTAPMLPLIISMALPAMFSMLVQALYNIVDSYFVAQYSTEALAAVSLAFPIQNLIISFAVGTAIGAGSLISRKLGEGNKKAAESAAAHSIVLSVITWILFVIFGITCSGLFYNMFESNPNIIEMGSEYLSIVSIFSVGVFVQISFEKMLQATGNMFWPMMIQLIGAVINIILDPIMIFGMFGLPQMGVAGAAWATVIGQLAGAVVGVLAMIFKDHEIKVSLRGFRFNKTTIKDIYVVGIPTIVMNSIGTVMIMAMNAILAGFSAAAYTVFGVYFKLQSFVFMPIFGLSSGVMPIMGYNYGARNKARLMSCLKFAIIIAVSINAIGTVIFELFPKELLSIFNATDEIIAIGVPALRIISTTFVIAAVCIITSTLFQSVGKGVFSLISSILRQLVVLVPAAMVLSQISLTATWFALPISDVFALVVTIILFIIMYKQSIKNLNSVETGTITNE